MKIERKSVIFKMTFVDYEDISDRKQAVKVLKKSLHYFDEREGVLKVTDEDPCTKEQLNLIINLITKNEKYDKDLYEKFFAKQTYENADNLIRIMVINDKSNAKDLANYLIYGDRRKGAVKKIDTDDDEIEYGTFDKEGAVDVNVVIDKMINYVIDKNNIYWKNYLTIDMPIAKELGYDKVEKWALLYAKVMPKVAQVMGIDYGDLEYSYNVHYKNNPDTGAHNYHTHLNFYSKGEKQLRFKPYKTEKIIQSLHKIIRSEIFREQKDYILKENKVIFNELNNLISSNILNIPIEIIKQIQNNIEGRGYYQYQSQEMKLLINYNLKNMIESNEQLLNLFMAWLQNLDALDSIVNNYTSSSIKDKLDLFIANDAPLKDKLIKQLANTLIQSCVSYDGKNKKIVNNNSIITSNDIVELINLQPLNFTVNSIKYSNLKTLEILVNDNEAASLTNYNKAFATKIIINQILNRHYKHSINNENQEENKKENKSFFDDEIFKKNFFNL